MLYRDRGGSQEFTAQDGTPAAFTSVATLDVISQGPSPDFLFHATYLIRVNPLRSKITSSSSVKVKGVRPA